MQDEFQVPFPEPFRGVADRLPHSVVPEHHRSTAVFAFGDDSLKAAVFQRMVFDLHRQALVGGIEIRAFGHGPALEHAVQLQAEVVMEVRGIVLLDDKRQLAPPDFGARLPRGSGVFRKSRLCRYSVRPMGRHPRS